MARKERELDYAELKEEYKRLESENQLLRAVTYYEEKRKLAEQVNELKIENDKLKKIDWHQKRKIRELTLLLLAKVKKIKEKK